MPRGGVQAQPATLVEMWGNALMSGHVTALAVQRFGHSHFFLGTNDGHLCICDVQVGARG